MVTWADSLGTTGFFAWRWYGFGNAGQVLRQQPAAKF
jgi:hypothetical protein